MPTAPLSPPGSGKALIMGSIVLHLVCVFYVVQAVFQTAKSYALAYVVAFITMAATAWSLASGLYEKLGRRGIALFLFLVACMVVASAMLLADNIVLDEGGAGLQLLRGYAGVFYVATLASAYRYPSSSSRAYPVLRDLATADHWDLGARKRALEAALANNTGTLARISELRFAHPDLATNAEVAALCADVRRDLGHWTAVSEAYAVRFEAGDAVPQAPGS
ncbi:uncharacterized protein LOC62_07G008982 [Vanrija pseudolonga]|uniref:Uncharacterized protein n=1 Tax=Vanrija pseudolonga TaxID=143232 RepID=A0AAF1BU18_9TREE|nr:hypothetical protein LOC62_07G008982 [Vanrija pseudolonga]